MKLRFAFDLGTNSIGTAVWRIGPDPNGIFGEDAPLELLWAGVRIFKDGRNPKDQKSLAEMRRVPRQARKRRDRFVLRRNDLMGALIRHGLMPRDEAERIRLCALDPYMLRAKALQHEISLHELGRAIFHMNQRRGFKSNRKTDKADEDKGKIASATKRLGELLQEHGCETFGEFLWKRHGGDLENPKRVRSRQSTRIRLEGSGAKALYEFYPTRALVRDEFYLIWARQAKHHPSELGDAIRDEIGGILFRQRDLKPPKVGRCTFVPDETRLPKALFSVRARELYERLGHLRITEASVLERPLGIEERDTLAQVLLYEAKVSMVKLRKLLKLNSTARINFEEAGEKELMGLAESKALLDPRALGPRWREMSIPDKDALISLLIEEPNEDRLNEELQRRYGLSPEAAQQCANVKTQEGYSRLGPSANSAILDALMNEEGPFRTALTYSQAVERAGWHHSDERDGEILAGLPYYGKVLQRHVVPGSLAPEDEGDDAAYWGRITNPTVHIGLNQLRRIINALVRKFGHPDQICLELARELKLGREQKERERKQNAQNRAANEARARRLAELGIPDSGENRARLKLFEEQCVAGGGVALCPFSGRTISISALFSGDIEVEHILPRSRTLDDTSANKVLCFRDMNRLKRGKSPFEAFGSSPEWEEIAQRGAALPPSKRWRFRPDAMKEFEGERDFLARQLQETRYLSKIARSYVQKICNDPNAVYVMPGRMTSLLRGKWGLNSILSDDNRKERTDHRHHAIDAIAIGATTRSLIQFVARQSGRLEQEKIDDVVGRIPWPFEGFRNHIREKVEPLIVSFKPEHGKAAALHEDSIYGLVGNAHEREIIGNLVRRKPLVDLTAAEAARIRDPMLRKSVMDAVADLLDEKGKLQKGQEKAFKACLDALARNLGVRRVRVGKEDASVVAIRNKANGKQDKAVAPGENHHIDVVQMRDGSWRGFTETFFAVNQKGWRPIWEKEKLGGKLVMRLHKGDLLELDRGDGSREVKQVVQIRGASETLFLALHKDGGKLQERHDDKEDVFRWDMASMKSLKERNCRAVRINDIGEKQYRATNV